jgi:hypothetical protein
MYRRKYASSGGAPWEPRAGADGLVSHSAGLASGSASLN